MAQSTSSSDIRDLPGHPFQPVSFQFPLHSFGRNNSCMAKFQSSWFYHWKWIDYDTTIDAAFCFSCCKAFGFSCCLSCCQNVSSQKLNLQNSKNFSCIAVTHHHSPPGHTTYFSLLRLFTIILAIATIILCVWMKEISTNIFFIYCCEPDCIVAISYMHCKM